MNKYWVYIVDNYQRDLSSLCWWAINSNFHKKDQVCLVPKFEINPNFISREMPDVIVWNYARPNNIKWIKLAHALGIFNIIHDTEGIPRDITTYFNGIKSGDLKYIDEIWCWGNKQADFLTNRFKNIKKLVKIRITGSIRYEYAKTLEKVFYQDNINKVIWNTSFSTLSPKYQSPWREFTQHHEYLELSREETLNKFITFASERQTGIEYIKLIASYSQSYQVTLRPHPFESNNYYMQSFKNLFSNIKFSISEDVNLDLSNHSLVIQYGCQTALDAFIRGVPSIKPNRDDINIWSKVTPYVDPIVLREKLTDINFLQEILEIQKKLFQENKINQLLFNLDKSIEIIAYNPKNNLNKLFRKQKGFKEKVRINYLKFKYYIKKKLKINNIENGRKSLTSIDIKSFLEKNYKENLWSYENNKCLIKRY